MIDGVMVTRFPRKQLPSLSSTVVVLWLWEARPLAATLATLVIGIQRASYISSQENGHGERCLSESLVVTGWLLWFRRCG